MKTRLRRRTTNAGSIVVRALWIAGVLAVGVVGYRLLWHPQRPPLVVYCAHDSIFSEGILHAFEQRTGIPIAIRFDTEATKSLGLVELIMQERDHPRCDVFWNNELLGTLELAEADLLQPYRGPGFSRIPDTFKDPAGRWAGFAGRLRVWMVNTQRVEATEATVDRILAGSLERVAIAKPLYGTTRSHYTMLWQREGADKLKVWHRDWRVRGVREVNGNAAVKNLVASGLCDLGLTDTDDFFGAKDEGLPVAVLPVRLGDGATICIPNTVAIIRGTPRLAAAQQLVDYLLSQEVELELARGKARQIPLGPVNGQELPAEVQQLKQWATRSVSWLQIDSARRDCLAWLKSEYVP